MRKAAMSSAGTAPPKKELSDGYVGHASEDDHGMLGGKMGPIVADAAVMAAANLAV